MVGDLACGLILFISPGKAPALQAWKVKFSASLVRIRPCIHQSSLSWESNYLLYTWHSSYTLQICLSTVFSTTQAKPHFLHELSHPPQFLSMYPLFSILVSSFFKWLWCHNYHLTPVFLISSSVPLNVQLFLHRTLCIFASPVTSRTTIVHIIEYY